MQRVNRAICVDAGTGGEGVENLSCPIRGFLPDLRIVAIELACCYFDHGLNHTGLKNKSVTTIVRYYLAQHVIRKKCL
jgi:hypothetical protein